MQIDPRKLSNTYSIVARDPETGWLGVAVQTHQMGVGRIVQWLQPGVGAVATQSLVNISFGPMALAMHREGVPAPRVVDALVASDENAHRRQVAVVDRTGQVSAYTGSGCIPEASHRCGESYSVQANMMTYNTVVDAMAQAYEKASGDLAQRMLAALRAAQAEGGDIRGMQSATVVVVSGDSSRPEWETIYDLRVEEHENPVEELARLIRLRHSQLLDAEGYKLLEEGQRAAALAKWVEARQEAPELEETAFWQAVTLADNHDDVATAADILRPVLANDARRDLWIELIRRLDKCGLLEQKTTAEQLISALG